MNRCLFEGDCEHQDTAGNCMIDECKYYIDPDTLGDMKYHKKIDDDMEGI